MQGDVRCLTYGHNSELEWCRTLMTKLSKSALASCDFPVITEEQMNGLVSPDLMHMLAQASYC